MDVYIWDSGHERKDSTTQGDPTEPEDTFAAVTSALDRSSNPFASPLNQLFPNRSSDFHESFQSRFSDLQHDKDVARSSDYLFDGGDVANPARSSDYLHLEESMNPARFSNLQYVHQTQTQIATLSYVEAPETAKMCPSVPERDVGDATLRAPQVSSSTTETSESHAEQAISVAKSETEGQQSIPKSLEALNDDDKASRRTYNEIRDSLILIRDEITYYLNILTHHPLDNSSHGRTMPEYWNLYLDSERLLKSWEMSGSKIVEPSGESLPAEFVSGEVAPFIEEIFRLMEQLGTLTKTIRN